MMRPLDSVRLASAKLRAHRVRTGIITSIVALLFAGIVMVLAIVAGTTKSLGSFSGEGLGNRFIVKATPIVDTQSIYGTSNQAITSKLTDETSRLKVAKKAEAKRLGIDYDAATDQTLPISEYDAGNGTKQTVSNLSSAFANQTIKDYFNSLPHIAYDDFAKSAKQAGAQATYASTTMSMMSYGASQSSVTVVIDGKEQQQDNTNGMVKGIGQLSQGQWQYFDSELLKPFVLTGQSLAVGSDGSIPVIAPVSAAETVLKLSPVSSTASSDEQLGHLQTLRHDIAGKTAQLCYRNSSSAELLSTAKSQQDEMARNKGKADYTAPSLQYNVPTEACGEVTVKKDTRTYDEKKLAENQLNFKKQFEGYEDPVQGIITVRFVGLVPDSNYAMGFSVKDLLKNMLQSSLGEGWFSPITTVKPGSLAGRIAEPYSTTSAASRVYYAEFPDYESAKAFTKAQTCDAQLSMQEMMSYSPNKPDPRVTKCYAAGKYFDIAPFGNNASAIADLKAGVWKVMRYVAPVVLIIAALVLMGIVGKIIADSRRETAVFRALGATRSSIAQIYLNYSLFIAVFITLLATAIGSFGALWVHTKFSDDISVAAVLAYNASDVHKQFKLFGIDPLYIGIVIGLIVLATLLSTVIPLLTNVRRNPIRDMRDE